MQLVVEFQEDLEELMNWKEKPVQGRSMTKDVTKRAQQDRVEIRWSFELRLNCKKGRLSLSQGEHVAEKNSIGSDKRLWRLQLFVQR